MWYHLRLNANLIKLESIKFNSNQAELKKRTNALDSINFNFRKTLIMCDENCDEFHREGARNHRNGTKPN